MSDPTAVIHSDREILMKNGALLRAAREAGYEVLVTVDRNVEYQQNVPASGLAPVVVRTRSTRVADLLPPVPALLHAGA